MKKKKMAKVITVLMLILTILLCFADNLFPQGFIGISAGNKGINLQGGVLSSNVELNLSYQKPVMRNDNPTIASIQVGYQINITDNDKDNYSITPSFGYGNYRIKDFTEYDKGGEIIHINNYYPVIGLEVGKDQFLGRYFLSANYCKGLYFLAGIKVYFRYNQLQKLNY